MIIQRICTYIVISFFFVGISFLLESDFLSSFLSENIVLIIITLLAINTATYGFIISKIDEMSKNAEVDFFDKAIVEIKKSLKYQIYLIAAAIVVSIFSSSKIIINSIEYHKVIFDFSLVFILVFALDLLRDTGFAIFELRDPNNQS